MPNDRLAHYGLLALVFVLAAALRLWGLAEQGVLSVDEGRYLLDGYSKAIELHWAWDVLEAKRAETAGGPEFVLADAVHAIHPTLSLNHPFAPKIGYTYAIAAVMLATGFTLWAASIIEAVFGLLCVLAVYRFVRMLMDDRVALAAAALLAFSCYHVYFSRNAYPQQFSVYLLLEALIVHLWWLRGGRDNEGPRHAAWLLVCGALCGLSFLVNYQVAGALPLICFVHLTCCVALPKWTEKASRFVTGGIAIAVGFFAMIILAEASSYPQIFLFRSQGLDYPHPTFFETLWPRLTVNTGVGYNWEGLVLFPYFLMLLEGPGVWMLVFGATGMALWVWIEECRGGRHSDLCTDWLRAWMYLIPALLVPTFLFSVKTMQGARMFTYSLPFFAIVVAVFAVYAWHTPQPRQALFRAVLGACALIAAASSAWGNWEVLRIRSAYPQAMTYINNSEMPAASSSWLAILESYAGVYDVTLGVPHRKDGPDPIPHNYLVSDWQEFYYGHYPDESSVMPDNAIPEVSFDHAFGRRFLEVEAFPGFARSFWSIRWVRGLDLDRARKLHLYNLPQTGLRAPDAPPRPAPPIWETRPK